MNGKKILMRPRMEMRKARRMIGPKNTPMSYPNSDVDDSDNKKCRQCFRSQKVL